MSKLICDICGTSYSDTEQACPTCGYARAFQEAASDEPRVPVVREKVRGGRFSKKNVEKRLKEQARRLAQAEPVRDLAEEMRAAPAEEERRNAEQAAEAPVVEEAMTPVEVPTEEAPVVEETMTPEEVPAEEAPGVEEAVIPEEVPILEELSIAEETSEEEPDIEAIMIPAMGIEEDVPEIEAVDIPMELPNEEEIEIVIPDELFAKKETEEILIPVTLFAEEAQPESEPSQGEEEAQDESETTQTPEEKEKKKKGGLALNVVLFVSLTAFVLSALYLLVNYGLPYLRSIEWPTQAVAETTLPTEEPTEALTDAPTEAPTDPPTEPPTEAPTDPPTEAPTEPLLDVKLELNYYDLTFGAANQTTPLKANMIPNEDITWISDDPSVVTISDTGVITAVGGGRTTVRAIYGDQEVTVKINCRF